MSGGPSVPDEVLSPLPAPGAHPPPTGGQPPVDGSVPVAGSVPPGPGVGEGSRGRVSPWNAANAPAASPVTITPCMTHTRTACAKVSVDAMMITNNEPNPGRSRPNGIRCSGAQNRT